MNKPKLNLCAMGDPTNPKNWSGTPFNIYSELKKLDRCGVAFDTDSPRRLKQFLSLLSTPFYGKVDIYRAPIRRYASAMNSARRTGASDSKHTLHMGSLALPFIRKPSDQHHYLFCDSTWSLWSRHATNMDTYSGRMISLFDRLEERAYSQMDHIFPISHYVKENLINHYNVPPSKITVVGTGLGVIKPFNGEKDYSARKILFTAKGRFRDKGGELVITAFRKALEIDPKLQLTIVGSEEGKKFDDCPNVTTLGFIPLPDLQKLFEDHSLFVMPAFNEPWGLVYLEAMVCKMPIMGLNRNSFPELSGEGKYGFCIKDENPTALANIMVEAFKNPTQLKEMGEQAQTYCLENFSWEKTVNRILNIISGEQDHE